MGGPGSIPDLFRLRVLRAEEVNLLFFLGLFPLLNTVRSNTPGTQYLQPKNRIIFIESVRPPRV